MTDDTNPYNGSKHTFIGHETVVHSTGEYVSGSVVSAIHVDTAESVHALLRRALLELIIIGAQRICIAT